MSLLAVIYIHIYSAVIAYVVWEPLFVSTLLRYIGSKVDPWNWSASVTVNTVRRIQVASSCSADVVSDDQLLALVSLDLSHFAT